MARPAPATHHPRSRLGTAVLALAVALLSPHAAPASEPGPPRVVEAAPDQGDDAVDPDLRVLRVRFDRPMTPGGHSICGGGPSFPTPAGRPHWADEHTVLIPVRLEPGKTYSLGINCPAAKNFRSAQGEPAEPFPLTFRTRGRGEPPPPAATITPEAALGVLDALRTAIDTRYSHRDLHRVDWPARLAEAAPVFAAATSRAQLGRAVLAALAPCRDPHLTVRWGVAVVGVPTREVTPNVNVQTLRRLVPGYTEAGQFAAWGRFGEGEAATGYIAIHAWPGDPDGLKPAHDALTALAACKTLVVDVRANAGGDELAARRFAARFLDRPAVYSRNDSRDPASPTGFGRMLDRAIEPAPEAERFTGRVALLIGPACMSSNESFIAMMLTSPRVTTLGATTRGSSGNPKPTDLGQGITVLLPSWRDFLPDGSPLEGRGIAPTIPIDASVNALAKRDPVLHGALDHLLSNP